jgi:5-oxopent-3-ene-1,2,5-tricarboxylate decarboxylase / 2-hydroxyhepta-2,4-diene-1,7-dioate isomerase
MSVLDGPRKELRRVVHGGRVHACTLVGDELCLDDGRRIPEADATYAAPVEPRTIVCVHLNYRSRAIEFDRALEGEQPTYFMKPASALNAHRGELVRPADCQLLNYEGEIAAVVGRSMRRVRPDEVWDHLAGFACANDVGAHDFRDTDAGSMLRVKGQDGFCPIGPSLVSGVDIRESMLRTYVNGQMVQQGAVREMVWGIDLLLADLSRHITLHPGDVVLTGTPWHSRPIFPGDRVEVEVDGLGRLTNTVVEGPAPDVAVGFPATVTKTSLGVALGSDYHLLKQPGQPPTADSYREARQALIARNMAEGPKKKEPR